MPTRPEDLHPDLVVALNAGDLEGVLALYDKNAVFVIEPGRVTDGPEDLRATLRRIIERDGTPFKIEARFADVLRQQADGHWLMVVDNGADAG